MADTDLRMGGVGGGGLKNLFWALPASVWSRDKGMGGGGGSPGSPSVSSPYMGVPRDLNLRPPAL